MTSPKPGQIWQHYKHDPTEPNSYTYEIVALGHDTETDQPSVIYRPLYPMPSELAEKGLTVFVRPLSNFLEEVETNGKTKSRFIKIDHS